MSNCVQSWDIWLFMENLWIRVALFCFIPAGWWSEDPSRQWLHTGWGESKETFGWTIWNSNCPKIRSFPDSKAFSYLIVLTCYDSNYFVVLMLASNQKLVCWKFLLFCLLLFILSFIVSAGAYGAAAWRTSGHCNAPVQVCCFHCIELVERKLGLFAHFVLNWKGIYWLHVKWMPSQSFWIKVLVVYQEENGKHRPVGLGVWLVLYVHASISLVQISKFCIDFLVDMSYAIWQYLLFDTELQTQVGLLKPRPVKAKGRESLGFKQPKLSMIWIFLSGITIFYRMAIHGLRFLFCCFLE